MTAVKICFEKKNLSSGRHLMWPDHFLRIDTEWHKAKFVFNQSTPSFLSNRRNLIISMNLFLERVLPNIGHPQDVFLLTAFEWSLKLTAFEWSLKFKTITANCIYCLLVLFCQHSTMLHHHSLTHCSTNTAMRQKSHLVVLGSFMCNFYICNRRVTKFTPKIDFKKK